MRLDVRHVSGSKAGLEQSFDPSSVRIGREPSNQIAFDPHQDIVVSGRHAEFAWDGKGWVVRDLGSANGTYIGTERVTLHELKSGDVVQFGRGGPKLEIRIHRAASRGPETGEVRVDNVGTTVMSINDIVNMRKTAAEPLSFQPVGSDGTVMMTAADLAASRGAGATGAAQSRTGSRTLRIILSALLIVTAGAIVGVLAFRKDPQPVAPKTVTRPEPSIEQQRADVRALEAKIAELQRQQAATTTTPDGVISSDLERQYRSAQDTIATLRVELEEKNDAVQAAENRQPETIVRYVRVPSDRPRQPQEASPTTAPAPIPVDAPPPMVVTRAPNAPIASPLEQPPAQQPAITQTTQSRSSIPQRATPPPVFVSSVAPTTLPQRAATAQMLPSPIAAERLVVAKEIKRRVSVGGLASDVMFVGAPPNFADELARSIGAALTSTGRFVVDRSAGQSVLVSVKSFRAEEKVSDTSRAASTASAIGGLLGLGRVNSPAQAKAVSYNAALAVQVTITDGRGREIASSSPSAALSGRQSSVRVDGARLSGRDLASNETPTADVVRQVVAEAVEDALGALDSVQGDVIIKGGKDTMYAVEAGRNMNIAPDDTFDVTDGSQVVARLRIDTVQETTATARLVSGTRELAGKRAVYVGTAVAVGGPAPTSNERFVIAREKTEAKDGPGRAFKTTNTIAPRTRARHLYSVAGWSRIQSGATSYWVPTSAVDFE